MADVQSRGRQGFLHVVERELHLSGRFGVCPVGSAPNDPERDELICLP